MSDLVRVLREQAIYDNDDYYSGDYRAQAADLIEQQQQRIVELEAERDSVCHLNDSLSLEREELAATVERLRSISESEYADEDERIADIQGILEATPQQNLAERDAEVARKAVEEYKLSITEPNATVHRYPVVDLSGFYLNGANGSPTMMFGHIENAESSTSQQAFIKCVIGRLLEILEEFDDEPSIVQKKNTDKPSVIRASFIDGYTAGNGYPPSDLEVDQYIKSIKDGE